MDKFLTIKEMANKLRVRERERVLSRLSRSISAS